MWLVPNLMNVFAICRAKHIHQCKDAFVHIAKLFIFEDFCNDLAFQKYHLSVYLSVYLSVIVCY